MTDYEKIRRKLEKKPYLVADAKTGEVLLADEKTVFRLMTEADAFPSQAILNLKAGIEKFSALPVIGKEDREFGMKQMAAFAGMSYDLFYHYLARRTILPSIREASQSGRGDVEARFSWADAFCAGIIGSLRRLGLKKEIIAKVQPLFTETKKQTDRVLAAASRS
jgi:hypothetical protein